MKTLRLLLIAAAALLAALLAAPAHAITVGQVATETGVIYLYDDPGPCAGRARRAEFVPSAGVGVIGGCWKPGLEVDLVRVVFLDGDVAHFPVAAIRPVRAL